MIMLCEAPFFALPVESKRRLRWSESKGRPWNCLCAAMGAKMRNIILAVTIVLCAAVILFFVGAGLGSLLSTLLPGDLAQLPKGLAGVPLGATKGVYESLEAR